MALALPVCRAGAHLLAAKNQAAATRVSALVVGARARFSTSRLAYGTAGVTGSTGAGRWRRALVNAHASDEFYTTRLDLAEAATIVNEPGYLWAAATADAAASKQTTEAYMANVAAKAAAYVRSKEVYGRDEVQSQLRELFAKGDGALALVLGAKNVGKSLLLAKQAESLREPPYDRRVVAYDARLHGSDLAGGIMACIHDQQPATFKMMAHAFMDGATSAAADVAGSVVGSAVGISEAAASSATEKLLRRFLASPPSLTAVLQQYVTVCEQLSMYPCLIIDEANVALDASTPEARARTIEALRALTQFTKQEQRMNVVLAASEHSEPFRLSALGFKSDHFTHTVVVGEEPPAGMRDLLMTKWGLGPNLADACMSVWGGHVWGVSRGLKLLQVHRAGMRAIQNIVSFSFDAMRGAAACVQAEEKSSNIKGAADPKQRQMRALLHQAVERGYAPFEDEEDPRVQLGSLRNVLAVVMASASAAHVPREAFVSSDFVAVPATQSMRVLLARSLSNYEQQLRAKASDSTMA